MVHKRKNHLNKIFGGENNVSRDNDNKTWLIDSVVRYSERKHKHEFVPIELGLNVRESINDVITNKVYEHYLFIAEQTYYLLNNKISPLGLKKLQKYYVAKVQELGMTSVHGSIRWKELISSFSNYYGKELLQSFNSYVEFGKEDTWLHKLLRKPEICCHPLRYILFLGFLGETIFKMVSRIDTFSYSPFGGGPWFCLNKAAKHYQELIVTSCTITRDYKSGLPVGTFSCSCGFVYSRKGPDATGENQCEIGRIKNLGSVWEDKLAELAQRGYSIRKMADLLGVDPNTVEKKLTKKMENKQSNNFIKQKEIQQNYRNQWINMMKINEGASITDMRI